MKHQKSILKYCLISCSKKLYLKVLNMHAKANGPQLFVSQTSPHFSCDHCVLTVTVAVASALSTSSSTASLSSTVSIGTSSSCANCASSSTAATTTRTSSSLVTAVLTSSRSSSSSSMTSYTNPNHVSINKTTSCGCNHISLT
jgi:hypothetical protein